MNEDKQLYLPVESVTKMHPDVKLVRPTFILTFKSSADTEEMRF